MLSRHSGWRWAGSEIADLGITIFNIGQYLQPTLQHLPVQRFVHPDIFEIYKEKGLEMGFRVVESGPLVRSSYHADEQVRRLKTVEYLETKKASL